MEDLNSTYKSAAAGELGASESKSPSGSSENGRKNGEGSLATVVACRQCRMRKVRCDSARPLCRNCVRRSDACQYDVAPKRRGPDRQPGIRQRLYKKKPEGVTIPHRKPIKPSEIENNNGTSMHELHGPERKARRKTKEPVYKILDRVGSRTLPPTLIKEPPPSMQPLYPSTFDDRYLDVTLRAVGFESLDKLLRLADDEITASSSKMVNRNWHGPPSFAQYGQYSSHRPEDEDFHYNFNSDIPRGPSSSFHKHTWFDSLLSIYSDDPSQGAMRVYQDLSFLLNSTVYWLSFINFPRLVEGIFNPNARVFLQPSLVLSALALSTMMKSSEIGLGREGRDLALLLRDAAQSSLDASICASWIEPSLAQAAFFLAMFEATSHPTHSPTRISSSISLLDSIIQALSLTTIDANEPGAMTFLMDDIARISTTANGIKAATLGHQNSRATPFPTGVKTSQSQCTCGNVPAGLLVSRDGSLPNPAISTGKMQRFIDATMPTTSSSQSSFVLEGASRIETEWPDPTNIAEIQKEESRRLCWSAMMLVTALREYTPLKFEPSTWDLYVTRPENFALFFPGEFASRVSSGKSIWALHGRAAMLWNSCQKLCTKPDWKYRRAEIAGKAWMEANAIEEGLQEHACPAGHAPYAGREYLLQMKLLVSDGFTASAPIPHTFGHEKDSAKEWLAHRAGIARHVRMMAYFVTRFGPTVASLAVSKRPLSIWWAMFQIKTGTSLWRKHPSLTVALEQSIDLLAIVDFMTVLWPSDVQRRYYEEIRTELLESCLLAGIRVPAAVPIPGLPIVLNATMIPSLSMAKEASAADILMAPLD